MIIKKMNARTAAEATKTCIEAIREHRQRFLTITFDNGTEFHSYKEMEQAYPVKCYSATPYHS